jgi:lysozyme
MMNTFVKKVQGFFRRGNAFLILILILIFLIAVSAIFITLTNAKTSTSAATKVESVSGNNELVIDDIYDGKITIPKFNIPVNTYDTSLFSSSNGVVSYSGSKTYTGIDVSEHQGVIDWAKVKASGVDFAIIRVGYRGYTRGKVYVDAQLENNLKGASENGIKIGLYFYSQALTAAEAEEEAGTVIENAVNYTIDYPVVFDWEPITDDNSRSANASGDTITACAAAFCSKVSNAGYHASVYINKSQGYSFYDLDKLSSYDIWLAEYTDKPSFYYNFKMWQYTDSGNVDGIDGSVDLILSFQNYSK